MQGTPAAVGLAVANWSWKVVRQFVQERFGVSLRRSSCWKYLRRLGFVLKRVKKRLTKADPAKRQAFVARYAAMCAEARRTGTKIIFVDEAHFYADVDARARWTLRGEPALVDSTSPRYGEKASYYSGVCLETGEVEAMAVTQNSSSQTSVAFLKQLRSRHDKPLIVIWDNGPAHRGQAIRDYLATPELNLTLVALPAYSPDFNPDESLWDWARKEVTANICFGTAANVRHHLDAFFAGLSNRAAEVTKRCRKPLQAQADALLAAAQINSNHVVPIVDSV